jgi:hypothetical protein
MSAETRRFGQGCGPRVFQHRRGTPPGNWLKTLNGLRELGPGWGHDRRRPGPHPGGNFARLNNPIGHHSVGVTKRCCFTPLQSTFVKSRPGTAPRKGTFAPSPYVTRGVDVRHASRKAFARARLKTSVVAAAVVATAGGAGSGALGAPRLASSRAGIVRKTGYWIGSGSA